jgi:hypothetical protein
MGAKRQHGGAGFQFAVVIAIVQKNACENQTRPRKTSTWRARRTRTSGVAELHGGGSRWNEKEIAQTTHLPLLNNECAQRGTDDLIRWFAPQFNLRWLRFCLRM